MTKDYILMALAERWTHKYTKREVEIMLAGNDTYTPLEKDKLLYYFNCYNECNEVAVPYGLTMEKQNETTNQSEDTVL